jgi:regulator of protease activity HflC (stomatin/prohibitin superfamily)
MGLPIGNLREATSAGGNFMTGTFGKLLGGAAGLLLLIKLVSETFYFVPVGFRGVKLRGGHPIRKRAWRKIGPIAFRCGRRTGPYKIKRGGVGMKIPFYHTVEKVNIQERTQVLRRITADCPDGQREFDIELITRIPCEMDGPEFADYPARVVITSSEPDQIFESYARTALRTVLKVATTDQRDDEEWLTNYVNERSGKKFDRVGYRLLDVNLGEDSLTAPAVVAKYFSPKWEQYHPDESARPETPVETDNVYPLPPVAFAAAGLNLDQAEPS